MIAKQNIDTGIRLFKSILKNILGLGAIANSLTILPDDIFLVSYPRSGNTWTRFLLSNLIYDVQPDFDSIENYIPDIYRNSDRRMLRLPKPRILKSHEMFDPRYPKVIYIIRDGRDVAVSYYYYHRKFKAYNKNFDSFITEFVSGKLDRFGTWSANVTSWLENKDKVRNDFLLLKYEDMLRNIRESMRKICTFLELQCSEESITKAIKKSSLEIMQQIEAKTEHQSKLFKNSNKQIKFIDGVKHQGWQNIFTEYSKKIFKKNFGWLLIELGYEKSLNW